MIFLWYHNFLIRIWLHFAGFGFGTIMLEGFRVSRFIENEKAIDCFGPLYTAQIVLRVLLVFSETLFMTKNHTVSIIQCIQKQWTKTIILNLKGNAYSDGKLQNNVPFFSCFSKTIQNLSDRSLSYHFKLTQKWHFFLLVWQGIAPSHTVPVINVIASLKKYPSIHALNFPLWQPAWFRGWKPSSSSIPSKLCTCIHNMWPTYSLVKSHYVSQMLVDQLLTNPHNRWPWHWLRFD